MIPQENIADEWRYNEAAMISNSKILKTAGELNEIWGDGARKF